MSGSLGSSLYATPGLGEAVGALQDSLFGSARREGDRYRNMAVAERAREEIETLRMGRRLREQRGQLLGELVAQGLSPQQIAARMAHLLIQADGADAPALRVGLGAAIAPGAPRDVADVVGATGGNANHTRYAVDEGNATSTRNAGIQAGATLGAARIAQEGQNWRFMRTPINPGADGVFVSPDQARVFGLPGAQPNAGYFLPGATNVSPGATRVSPQPGPMLGDTVPMAPPMVAAPAPDRSVAGYTADLLRRFAAGDAAAIEEVQRLEAAGIRLRDMATPGVVSTETRASSQERVAALNAEINRLRVEQQAATAAGRMDLARELAQQITDRQLALQQMRGDTAVTVQGMRGDTQERIAEGQNQTAVGVARIRAEAAAGRPPRAFNAAEQQAINDALESLNPGDSRATALIAALAGSLVRDGVAPQAAALSAAEQLVADGTLIDGRRNWTGRNFTVSPRVNVQAVLGGAAPAAPPPPRPSSGLPPAQQDAPRATVPPPAARQVGAVYPTPLGPMMWTGTGWRPAQ